MREIKRLTWKYFLEEKWEEIKPFLALFGFIGIMCFLLYLGMSFKPWNWQSILLIIILGMILIVSLTIWIKSNWKKAEQKARRGLK